MNRFPARVTELLASGFYTGFLPVAPGTFGTAAAVPLYLLFSTLPSVGHYLGAVALFIVLACVTADRAERLWGEKDCQKIVIDEWAGFLVTMTGVSPGLLSVTAGFVIFRILDIAKPFPLRRLERLIPGGAGVVADDVGAGVYGCLLLHAGLALAGR